MAPHSTRHHNHRRSADQSGGRNTRGGKHAAAEAAVKTSTPVTANKLHGGGRSSGRGEQSERSDRTLLGVRKARHEQSKCRDNCNGESEEDSAGFRDLLSRYFLFIEHADGPFISREKSPSEMKSFLEG
jgi:hypothetical protein